MEYGIFLNQVNPYNDQAGNEASLYEFSYFFKYTYLWPVTCALFTTHEENSRNVLTKVLTQNFIYILKARSITKRRLNKGEL